MKHLTEEELIAYREGMAEQRAHISDHLAACQECREGLERIEAVLAALDRKNGNAGGRPGGSRGVWRPWERLWH
jgi:anti-sigma factor ChrR (cupin superfamily)